jgi:excisionase family DNA binding protein
MPLLMVDAVVEGPFATAKEGAMKVQENRPKETVAEWYDVPCLAQMLNVSEDFVRAQVQQRRIPYYKVGKLIRFDPREITQWLAGLRVEPMF